MINFQRLIWLTLFLYLVNQTNCYSQTIAQINTKIDSLSQIINKMEIDLKSLNDQKQQLEKEKEIIESKNANNEITTIRIKSKSSLLSEPSNISKKLMDIPAGAIVQPVDYYKSFFKIIYQNKIGYVWEVTIENDEVTEKFKKTKTQQNKQEEKLKNQELQGQRKKMLVKKYGETAANRIMQSKIWLGMSQEMAIESLGKPKDINKTVGSWGVHEQWVYNTGYLYFQNGKLTSWQN